MRRTRRRVREGQTVDPDVVFDEICSVIGKISSVPRGREEQKVFAESVIALSAWIARGGRPPAQAGRDLDGWLAGTRAALYVLRGHSQ